MASMNARCNGAWQRRERAHRCVCVGVMDVGGRCAGVARGDVELDEVGTQPDEARTTTSVGSGTRIANNYCDVSRAE